MLPGADDLRRIALRRVRRPDVEVVAELRRQEPAGERQEELLQLHVLAPLHGLHVPERIDVGLVEALLIQIARVAEEPEVHLALVALDEQESDVGDVARAPSSWAPACRRRPRRARRRSRPRSRPRPRRPCRRSPRSFRAGTADAPDDRASTTPFDVSAGHCWRSPTFDAHVMMTALGTVTGDWVASGGEAGAAPPGACAAGRPCDAAPGRGPTGTWRRQREDVRSDPGDGHSAKGDNAGDRRLFTWPRNDCAPPTARTRAGATPPACVTPARRKDVERLDASLTAGAVPRAARGFREP